MTISEQDLQSFAITIGISDKYGNRIGSRNSTWAEQFQGLDNFLKKFRQDFNHEWMGFIPITQQNNVRRNFLILFNHLLDTARQQQKTNIENALNQYLLQFDAMFPNFRQAYWQAFDYAIIMDCYSNPENYLVWKDSGEFALSYD